MEKIGFSGTWGEARDQIAAALKEIVFAGNCYAKIVDVGRSIKRSLLTASMSENLRPVQDLRPLIQGLFDGALNELETILEGTLRCTQKVEFCAFRANFGEARPAVIGVLRTHTRTMMVSLGVRWRVVEFTTERQRDIGSLAREKTEKLEFAYSPDRARALITKLQGAFETLARRIPDNHNLIASAPAWSYPLHSWCHAATVWETVAESFKDVCSMALFLSYQLDQSKKH